MSFLRYPNREDRIFNRVISDISVVLRETTLTISDSIQTGSPVEKEIVRVVSLTTTEITENNTISKKKRNLKRKNGIIFAFYSFVLVKNT